MNGWHRITAESPAARVAVMVYEAGTVRILNRHWTNGPWADRDEVVAGARPTHWHPLPDHRYLSAVDDGTRTCDLCGTDATCVGDHGSAGFGYHCDTCGPHDHCTSLTEPGPLADLVITLVERLTSAQGADPGPVDFARQEVERVLRHGPMTALDAWERAIRHEERGRWAVVDYAARRLAAHWLGRGGAQSAGSYVDRRRLADLARALGAEVPLWDDLDALTPEGWEDRMAGLVEASRVIRGTWWPNRGEGLTGSTGTSSSGGN